MTNKQRRALRRERARDKQRKKAVRRAVAVNMQSVRSGAYMAARERQDRFEVDPSRTWYVIRTLPRWATKAAEQITASGTPVFEAREAIRLVSDIGKVRLALIPVLRRLIFVGVKDWQELRHVESHPGVYDDLTGYGRSGVVQRPGGGHMTISPEDLQNFADCITGVGGDDESALGLIYEIGGVVRVKEGALASFNGNVEAIDERTGRLRISVDIFGRRTTVELDENQVEAA